MKNKKIIIVFEDHRDGIESLAFSNLLKRLNNQSIKVTDLVLEDTQGETSEVLLEKYKYILKNPNTYSEYIKGQYETLLYAKHCNTKIHAADVPKKIFDDYSQSNHINIQSIIEAFYEFIIEDALGEAGLQKLHQLYPNFNDEILIRSFIENNSKSLWENFSKTETFKKYMDQDISSPMIVDRDHNFVKQIEEIAKFAKGVVLVQLGSRHANVVNLLKEKGYTNIVPLLIDLEMKDFDGMALNYHLQKINFPSKFIISSKDKTIEQLEEQMMMQIRLLSSENLQNFATTDPNSLVNFKSFATTTTEGWYTEDIIRTLLENSILSDQEHFYISPQTQFEHNDLLSANLAEAILNVIDGRVALMPVNIHNNHWIGMVIMQQGDEAIRVIINDPMGNSIQNEPNALLLVQTITNLIHNFATDRRLNIIDLELQQQSQNDQVNCGPITVENLSLLAQVASIVDNQNLNRDEIIEAAGLSSVIGAEARSEHNIILKNLAGENIPQDELSLEITDEITLSSLMQKEELSYASNSISSNSLGYIGIAGILIISFLYYSNNGWDMDN